jgi:serine/threonine-protein kinase
MYLLLTGRPVHEAETVNDQLILAATAYAPSIAKYRSDLPKEIVELVGRALVREPLGRWSDARAMQEAVRKAAKRFALSEPIKAPPERAISLPDVPVRPTPVGSSVRVSPLDPTLAAASATGPAVTNSVNHTLVSPSQGTPERRVRLTKLAVAGLLLVGAVIVAFGWTSGRSRAPAAQHTFSSAAPEPEPQKRMPIIANSAPSVQVKAPKEPEQASTASDEPSPSVSASVALPAPKAPRASSARHANPKPRPSTQSTASPSPTSNPFDRRF